MARETLLGFFEDYFAQPDVFVVDDDGYRIREVTYSQIGRAAREFAVRLGLHGIRPHDHVVIWSENRAEWIAAFWGSVLAGVVVVPLDARASAETLSRIATLVRAKAILVGEQVHAPADLVCSVWPLDELLKRPADGTLEARVPAGSRGSTEPPPLAEIIFTSGATSEPRGVTITHRNILANLLPIEREIRKYRRYERPFHPIRFLNLLPLSHLFGQSMATFVPPMIGGTVVFARANDPGAIARQIASRRVSVLVAVPKVLDVLREHILRIAPEAGEPDALAGRRWWWRWWRYRRIHRVFGWKFWAIVVGAAPLGAESEAFWRKLGFVIVQGYGLTEAAPIVTLNHPFHASAGTVGVPIPGVEVRIEADGEILVRGENVTSGYFSSNGDAATSPGPAAIVDAEGWLHTGDVGALDSAGRLTIKGRKKEMIVTAQGFNVFPEDVERTLLSQPGVTDAAVVGLRVGGEERIHAVLILEPGVDLDATIRSANATLEDHQRVWRGVVWPGAELLRTEGTRKVRRLEVRRWLEETGSHPSTIAQGGPSEVEGQGPRVQEIVRRFSGGRALNAGTTLEELGLSSLDRVELSIALEQAFETTLDESALANVRTVGDLEDLASKPGERARAGPAEAWRFPRWNRRLVWRVTRRLSLPTWILPLARVFMKLEVRGLEHLRDLKGPVVFGVNHQSLMDVPAVLIALPARWRYRVAPAMAREFFDAHFHRRQYGWWAWWTSTLNYVLSSLFFNAFPFPQREAGARPTLRYIGEVSALGDSILIFPEGQRTSTGAIGSFRPGVALIASRLELPVIPVRLDGLDKVLHRSMGFPTRGPVRVTFGHALTLTGDDYPAMARAVEEAVRAL